MITPSLSPHHFPPRRCRPSSLLPQLLAVVPLGRPCVADNQSAEKVKDQSSRPSSELLLRQPSPHCPHACTGPPERSSSPDPEPPPISYLRRPLALLCRSRSSPKLLPLKLASPSRSSPPDGLSLAVALSFPQRRCLTSSFPR
jgi:hypothetical protein